LVGRIFFILMRYLISIVFLFFVGCSSSYVNSGELFTDVTKIASVDFENSLTFTERLNPYTYRNFYNGAGVSVGDVNNDGLLDIYFAGNQVSNRLYVNCGNFKFKDVTESARVSCKGAWSSGVTMADVNGDGYLDIYVCKSGDPDSPNRANELFINNKDLTFTESAKEYGLDVKGLSVQAAFFDYDKDGDLDCYLLTNSIKSVGNYDIVKDQREIADRQGGGNKFFINDNGKFRDYSESANIYRSNIGFGLGITLGDYNEDSWVDIYVSNDFFERDYLYLNNQKGAFKESLTDYFESISMGSMGADYADLDNDGSPELFVTEMLPDSLARRKTKTVFENWNKYQLDVENGYHHQFSRNVLQTKIAKNKFGEIGRLAGVSASEWSWGALLFDMDNDGKRDIFIANGIYKDLLDRDYLNFTADGDNVRRIIKEEKNAILKLIDLMPSSSFSNYAFKNEGNFKFNNKSKEWGLGSSMFSCGSAYGDFDNDGDLDLVVNTINSPAKLYRNNTDTSKFKSVTISLTSTSKNTFQLGTKVCLYMGDSIFSADNFVAKGFQSSVQNRMTIGIGNKKEKIDSLVITWPDSGYTVIKDVKANSMLTINKESVQIGPGTSESNDRSALPFSLALVSDKLFKHSPSGLNDFNRERLLPMMYSSETPNMVVGNIANDGVDRIYVGGGKDQSGGFVDIANGSFTIPKEFEKYKLSDETKSVFFDADNDGDLDFYMATGGKFFPKTSSALMDRIFLNDGKGNFKESPYPLPFADFFSTSAVVPLDFDSDADIDLVVSERFDPFTYGLSGRAYLLENNGKGQFKDVTRNSASVLEKIGMITAMIKIDYNQDGWDDLALVGDWMPFMLLENNRGNFIDRTEQLGLSRTRGWFHDIKSADLNKDGKPDFICANHGENTFFKDGDRMYVNDFDSNGSVEQIFCTKIGDKYFPLLDRDELLAQLPSLKKELLYFKDYAKKAIGQIFSEEVLKNSTVFEVDRLASALILSESNGYRIMDLPCEAQYAPLYSLLIYDMDKDGIDDLIAGGNLYSVKPQFGRYDASLGWFFKGKLKNQKFGFENGMSLNVKGEIRDIKLVSIKGIDYLFFAKYDDNLEIYKVSR
jgi:enediyne biosynthesis protein E4